jgi:hypothetical protein
MGRTITQEQDLPALIFSAFRSLYSENLGRSVRNLQYLEWRGLDGGSSPVNRPACPAVKCLDLRPLGKKLADHRWRRLASFVGMMQRLEQREQA